MGTSHRTIKTPVFKFNQLSEEAKARALDKNRDWNVDHNWWDGVYEDAIRIADCLGISIDTRKGGGKEPSIYFSGFSSQGDGASFEGSYSYRKGSRTELNGQAPEFHRDETGKKVLNENNAELHRICKALTAVQKKHFYRLEAEVTAYGHYSHSGCTRIEVTDAEDQYRDIGDAEGEVAQLLRDFMDWIYSTLGRSYDYLTSDEAVAESLEANDVEFTAEGDRV
jgi:hypothetical protein